MLAVLPVLAVATLGLATSAHPQHVREALTSLWIGGACLVGWSLALTGTQHRRLLRGLIVPATLLALLAVLQFYGVLTPFRFEREVSERSGMTSLAGGAFDLAAYLTLPCLVAQLAWRGASAVRLGGWLVAGGVCVYALLLTQTLTAIAAFAAGTFVVWAFLLPRRRIAVVAASLLLGSAALGFGVEPLRERLVRKLDALQRGDVHRTLSGRPDGWRTALWMVRQHPVAGVGHGAYRAEYGRAKSALSRQGHRFSQARDQAYFVNAHSDFLEALAEWGLLGAAAIAWGLAVLARTLRRLTAAAERSDVALMCGGLVALSLLMLANFPLRVALVAYPAILFSSWIFALEREARG